LAFCLRIPTLYSTPGQYDPSLYRSGQGPGPVCHARKLKGKYGSKKEAKKNAKAKRKKIPKRKEKYGSQTKKNKYGKHK
jgi:hypothetical protein